MTLSSSTSPTAWGLGTDEGIPTAHNEVTTHPMAASASVSRGDWVQIHTTADTVTKCSDTAASPDGIAWVDVNNTYKDDGVTAGAAGDKYCPVLRKGFAYVDGMVTASGNYAATIYFNDLVYLNGSISGIGTEGQAVSAYSSGGTLAGRSLDYVAVPSASALYKIRVYIDRLSKATMT